MKLLLVLIVLLLPVIGCVPNSYKGDFEGFGDLSVTIGKGSDYACGKYASRTYLDDEGRVTHKDVIASVEMVGSKSEAVEAGKSVANAFLMGQAAADDDLIFADSNTSRCSGANPFEEE